jgi:hypothetical protein
MEEIILLLTEEFDVSLPEAHQQVAKFLADLETKGLLAWVE